MDQQNKIILSLGSNYHKEENMKRAVVLLQACFASLRFSEAIYTEPIGCPQSKETFLNQVAIGNTTHNFEEVHVALKEFEKQLGRKAEDKQMGRIPIDIDLLQWNEEVLKPMDLKREDVISGLDSLLSAGEPT